MLASLPLHRPAQTTDGPQWEEEPLAQVWVSEGTLTMLSAGKAIAGIIPGNRHRLPAHLSVNVELLGQRVDHHGQVLLPHLGRREMAYHMGPQSPMPTYAHPALHQHLWETHQDEVCLISGQHQHRHMVLRQWCND